MKAALRNLQAQPHHVRTNAALMIAGTATALIAIVWVTTLPLRFEGSTQSAENTAAAVAGAGETIMPHLNSLQDSWGEIQGLQIAPNPTEGTSELEGTGY